MTIDSDYIASSSLEQYFVDKDTGEPLSNGLVFFWEDNNRSTPKSVYQLSGTPPNYSFSALPNPMSLNAVGTPEDGSGNNVIPYYYPFDENGEPQLYYVEAYSEGSILQFTREAWPPGASQDGGANQEDSTLNLTPNGQFKLHNNIAADPGTNSPAGKITGPITEIAPGGWTFERPVTTTATDNVSFYRFNSYTENPTGSPRYAVRLSTDGGSASDAFKDFRLKFNDVNKFSSDTQEYTVSFFAQTFSGTDFTLSLNIIKNYGTGGSPTENINIDNFVITSSPTTFSTTIIFGSNSGKVIGSQNDDYVQICLSCPTGISLGVDITDFVFFIGNIDVVSFPVTTDKDFIDRSLVPAIPNYNGYDIGLPLVLTKSGLTFDDSQVGKIFSTTSYLPEFAELLCDGQMYPTNGYSSDGIPYRRLRNKLMANPSTIFDSTQNIPMFGTGKDYVTASHIDDNGTFFISANKVGIQTPIADGAVPTGFTFTTVSAGQPNASSLSVRSYVSSTAGASYYWIFSDNIGRIPNSNFSTTPQQILNSYPNTAEGEIVGTPQTNQTVRVQSLGAPAPNSYIRIQNSPSTTIYAWFKLDGVGTAPSVTGILLEIDLLSNMGFQDTAYAISQAFNGYSIYTVQALPGNAVVPNSYFTFYANSQLYYVWYSLNGAGVDPLVGGGIGIEVSYTISDTALTVLNNSMNAINELYFAVPDLRGWTIKGWDNESVEDRNNALRFSLSQNRYNMDRVGLYNYIGSYQNHCVLSHSHSPVLADLFGPSSIQTQSFAGFPVKSSDAQNWIGNTGTAQNEVKNIYLNYVIKY